MPSKSASVKDYLKILPLFLLPHHAITRVVYWLTQLQSPLTQPAIKMFAAFFNVDMRDAAEENLSAYRTFNEFFTRSLKPTARPVAGGETEIAAPADGCVSAIGRIDKGRIFQAKGIDYSLATLLANDSKDSERLADGYFLTTYLSPRDYHRLHMPMSGRLIKQSHVPGRLFSVGPHTVRALPNLFTRNERVVAQFETDHGLMALVLVGAMNVAGIETIWHGLVEPANGSNASHIDYDQQRTTTVASEPVFLKKGEEMGRFNMGSTVIVLLQNKTVWHNNLQAGDTIRMGQFIGLVG